MFGNNERLVRNKPFIALALVVMVALGAILLYPFSVSRGVAEDFEKLSDAFEYRFKNIGLRRASADTPTYSSTTILQRNTFTSYQILG